MHTRWNKRLVGQAAVLILVNVMVDTVITAPLIVLPQMLDHFGTDQPAWLNAGALLAGAMWAPLLGKTADIHGKRKVLVWTLVLAGVGALVCMIAPGLWVFVLGRVVQGAAVASLFLTVGIVRDICETRIGMIVTGIVTTGNAVFGIAFPFLFETLSHAYGYRVVFVVSAVFAATGALLVRFFLPESVVRTPGRVDIAGALLLGGGIAAVVTYVSLGGDFGWTGAIPLPILLAGAVALACWVRLAHRTPDPVVDITKLSRPLVLTLGVVVLGTGAYQSMLQLFSLLADVSADEGLGYGLAAEGALGMLYGIPAIGIVLGGALAGALATRVGPAATLVAGVVLGLAGTLGLFAAVATLPLAVVCSFLLSLTAGALVTSGFNMASTLAPAERQGVVSSLVMVMIAIGSVILNFVGAAVLRSTRVDVGGAAANSATGVFGYIGIGTGAFVAAGVLAVLLVRAQRRASVASDPARAVDVA
ncbi:MFS transporter [Saccharothrix australiensis]|uniref:Putative MFS family arabinose efflux permease n=1 Tax=Saccharothrix australiensis TaxID=2072 RepID=A0A495VYC9_9PSEU|nr:MFS transporter [Saccharothrix australiensis]RKT53593.1 putative MFS family arabinose efflux permease [Saccharothrix australiensis]